MPAPTFGHTSSKTRIRTGGFINFFDVSTGTTFAPHHPRCITSLQVRFQFDDTDGTTTCISSVPESIAEKKRLRDNLRRAEAEAAAEMSTLRSEAEEDVAKQG